MRVWIVDSSSSIGLIEVYQTHKLSSIVLLLILLQLLSNWFKVHAHTGPLYIAEARSILDV